jgi:hypothetical protein
VVTAEALKEGEKMRKESRRVPRLVALGFFSAALQLSGNSCDSVEPRTRSLTVGVLREVVTLKEVA